jgi:bifunctional UDP-N-acetylglucosamine pyrophosphorylase/glucosamine-1-phosphate N-acetyltransferase
LSKALPRLNSNNQKKEFYLTDVLEILSGDGHRVGGYLTADANESLGVNSRVDLAKVEAALRQRTLRRLMEQGVTIVDPATTYIDESVKIAPDTVIFPQTFLKGETIIGTGCQIGPWSFIQDSKIENGVILRATFADSCRVRNDAMVGPFSRLRPGADIGPRSHVGNFSEIKKSRLAEGVKVNHLSYLGDAVVGKNVNIGAGTITCNYDGIKKSPTFIQDHAFIGSNANLIAPVRIGAHAVIGAGSSISRDVPAWALAVERSPVVVKRDWAKKKFKKKAQS